MVRRLAAPLLAALLLLASAGWATNYHYVDIFRMMEESFAGYRSEYPEVPETDEDAAAIRAVESARKLVARALARPSVAGFSSAAPKILKVISRSPDGGIRGATDELLGLGFVYAFQCEIQDLYTAMIQLPEGDEATALLEERSALEAEFDDFVGSVESTEQFLPGHSSYARRLVALMKAFARAAARAAGRGVRAEISLPPEGTFEFATGSVTGQMFVDPGTGLPWRVDLVATRRAGDAEETVRLSVRSSGGVATVGTQSHTTGSLVPGNYYNFAGPGQLFARIVNNETVLSFPPAEGSLQVFAIDPRRGTVSGSFLFVSGGLSIPAEASIRGTFSAKKLEIIEQSPEVVL